MRPVRHFVSKYFREGQFTTGPGGTLGGNEVEILPDGNWFERTFFYREFIWKRNRFVGIVLPALIVWSSWLLIMFVGDFWFEFRTRYFMTITMFFGSLISGATSEGGGAVAFPVMTLIFHISPEVARDFSMAIQSVGMVAASFTILYSRIKIEQISIVLCSAGGIIGVYIGMFVVFDYMEATLTKLVFVSVWLTFAVALFWLNRIIERHVHLDIARFDFQHLRFLSFLTPEEFKRKYQLDSTVIHVHYFHFFGVPVSLPSEYWKVLLLFVYGIIGGFLTGISGSGLDICCFSCLTLVFRVSEKVATPTSVVLMAFNSVIGILMRSFVGVEEEAFKFWLVSVPIVVVGAPVGAWLSSFCHRLVLSSFVYILDISQFILAMFILKLNGTLIGICVVIIITASCLFTAMSFFGEKLLARDLGFITDDKSLPTAKVEVVCDEKMQA